MSKQSPFYRWGKAHFAIFILHLPSTSPVHNSQGDGGGESHTGLGSSSAFAIKKELLLWVLLWAENTAGTFHTRLLMYEVSDWSKFTQ